MSSKLDTHKVELSVIIPFYNTQPEKYIKCINSLLPIAVPIEIIVVDDGSDKQFLNLCINAFNDKRIRWFHQNNEGVSSARNLGINQAKGKYICFVDSDDEVTPDFVKVINEKINQFDAEWVLFDVKEKNETNNVFHDRKIVEPAERHEAGQGIMCDLEYHKALEIYLNSKKLCECWGKLILRRCIIENQIKFRQGMLIGEDALFNAELLQVIEKVQYIALCGYLYNYTDRSAVRLLKDPVKRFEFLNNRFQRDMHLIDTRISPEKKDKIKARKKATYIYGIAQDCIKLVENSMMDIDMRGYIGKWLVSNQIFCNVSIFDCDFGKGWLYFFALKHKCWGLFSTFARLKHFKILLNRNKLGI